jgi:prophage endopeptidase
MSRTEFIITTALVLLVAFLVGWFASWLVHRMSRSSSTTADVGQLDQMADALQEAEETRDQAVTYMNEREEELMGQLNQTETELRAAMEGLQHARHETDELRSYIERSNM